MSFNMLIIPVILLIQNINECMKKVKIVKFVVLYMKFINDKLYNKIEKIRTKQLKCWRVIRD